MNKDIVTIYRLVINNHKKISEFITLNKSELDIKAIELMQDNELVSIDFSKVKTTREVFIEELKRITNCLS